MATRLNVDSAKLSDKIAKSGLKIGFICEKLGISRTAFGKKMRGDTPFRVVEVFVLCVLLSITEQEKEEIFLSIDAT